MFTVEIRINGVLLKHIYGHNTGVVINKKNSTKYDCHVYDCEKETLRKKCIIHIPEDGIDVLISKCLKESKNYGDI